MIMKIGTDHSGKNGVLNGDKVLCMLYTSSLTVLQTTVSKREEKEERKRTQ